jgi:MFS family permease
MVVLDVFAFLVIAYQSYSMDLLSLYLTRFGLGVYLGISGTIIPAYLVSISPPEMTGLIGSFNQLLITIGISVAYRLGYP